MLRFAPALALSALLCGVPATAQTQVQAAPVLSPGDAVRITVWRKPELSGEFFVAGDSSVAHPLYSELKVAGVPIGQVKERVRTFVERYETTPRVLVEPLFQVMVLGEVENPQLYTLRPEVTVAQAVSLAGGTTDRGNVKGVRLQRGGELFIIDLTLPDEGLAQSPIRSGDQIVVPRRRDWFREYVAPAGSIIAALTALVNIITR